MRKLALLLIALVVSYSSICAAGQDLAGPYAVKGWEPGQDQSAKTTYSGTAQLTKRGDVFVYEGDMDGHKYVGVGIFHPESKTLAIHFTEVDSGKMGVAHFSGKPNELIGLWAWLKDKQGKLGKEIWTRKK